MNTAQRHAQEPWRVFDPVDMGYEPDPSIIKPGIESPGAKGQQTIVLWGEKDEECGVMGNTPEEAEANAARIVACVNALAGVEDPAAYIAELKAHDSHHMKYIDELQADYEKHRTRIAELKAQRDELLRPLKNLVQAFTEHLEDHAIEKGVSVDVLCPCSGDQVKTAKAAIANAQK